MTIIVGTNVGVWEPIVIGRVGGALVVFVVSLFDKFNIDDLVGTLSVHLVNGIWGTVAVALFNSEYSIVVQLKGIVVIAIFTFVVSWIFFKLINIISPLRVDSEVEYDGLDISATGIESYPEFSKSKY